MLRDQRIDSAQMPGLDFIRGNGRCANPKRSEGYADWADPALR